MAVISYKKYPDQDLIIFTIEGNAELEDFLRIIQSLSEDDEITNVIWNVAGGSLGEITGDGMKQIAELLKKGHGMRANGKTALVGTSDLEYGLGRMFEAYADIEGLSVKYHTFRSLEEALAWIKPDTQ